MSWDPKREQMRGQLALAAYALAVNAVLAWLLSCLAMAIQPGMQRWWFAAFGAVTMPMAMRWLSLDARRAYEAAASRRYLGFDGSPPRVVSIADDCPSRWLVLLHIRMHPELRSREP
ncbi:MULTISPECIES: hypothetical protein [unclassified Burkholderia]|uniref:hypothetical protein n=1 Tax=unclassified Burkholderia TaxID=2613784 RepID=UPI00141DECED|nr:MULTISPECIES: hypothetical protein [unclassified Burkholderia]NIE83041.1 hypothetical protein [Burkholderia sp. Tr-860]NIF61845.1 hypothetical protein [Burkholderia sp. Cy-647]NIF96969.1 hypothetical protein [Burkholderia sp. Ax-1720]